MSICPRLRLSYLLLFTAVSAQLSPCLAQTPAPPPKPKLTLERLYSLPWVTGTRPESPVWSPDSHRVAFLWNDAGGNFDDVWITDVETAKPTRVTTMPQPESPADAGIDIVKLQQVERAESDHGVSDLLWAPDGRHLIFELHSRLFSVLPGEAPVPLTPAETPVSDAAVVATGVAPSATQGVATGVTKDVAPTAAPVRRVTGTSRAALAYLSVGDLWIIDLVDGRPGSARRIYSPGRADVYVESLHWSGDGQRLAFVEADATRVPKRGIPDYLGDETRLVSVKRPFPGEPSETRRLGVIAAGGGEVQWAQLGGDPMDQIFSVSWAPDDKTLLVDKSDLYIKDRHLLLIDPSDGRARVLLEEADRKNVTAEWWAEWAPDGHHVYFTSDRDNDYHVYRQALAGGAPQAITAGAWAVFSATLAPAADALFVVTNAGKPEVRRVSRVALARGAIAGRAPRLVTAAEGAHKAVPSPDGKYLADVYSNDVTPPDLYLQDARGREPPRQVTHSPLPEFAAYHWVAAKYVTFPNGTDGTTLHARLTLPPDFDPHKKYPAILGSVYSNTVHNEWGGRIYHPTWGLDQFLAQQGFVIMNVDISGSSGYGKRFRQRIREDYGGVDVDDLAAGARYLAAEGYVDPARVGIWGSSYGGLLTAMSLFRNPGLYRAGVAGAPATSLFHALTGEMQTMMAPQDHQEQYARASAFLRSGALQDHLMIIHGMRDDTVLFKDSVTLEERLILQGKDIDFVPLPNAPHGWDTLGLAQTRYAYRKLYDYFERYLGAQQRYLGPQP
jgi:dipeptidyl-peptidase-4